MTLRRSRWNDSRNRFYCRRRRGRSVRRHIRSNDDEQGGNEPGDARGDPSEQAQLNVFMQSILGSTAPERGSTNSTECRFAGRGNARNQFGGACRGNPENRSRIATPPCLGPTGAAVVCNASPTSRTVSSVTAMSARNRRDAGVKGARVGKAASVIDLASATLPADPTV